MKDIFLRAWQTKWQLFLPFMHCLMLSGSLHASEKPAEYASLIECLDSFIKAEQQTKNLPAVSIALVEGERVVWSAGFGIASHSKGSLTSASTNYRVGSVSKLFNSLALMRLVANGKLELDEDISTYLPEFRPENSFGKAITLRHLVSHQSGLVRESPVGSYFDPTPPSLHETVMSLNSTRVLFEPGTRTKYSNAAVSVAGMIVERVAGIPFEEYVQRAILEPLQMRSSSFYRTQAIEANLPESWMWAHHREPFPAPTFAMGIAPAGNLYSTVDDLAKMMIVMFGGDVPDELGLTRKQLQEMISLTSAERKEGHDYGIGFRLGTLDGHPTFGHGGAVYGYATQFKGLPNEKIGVVVAVAQDGANGVANRVGDYALRLLLARQKGEPLPSIESSRALETGVARQLEGRYSCEDQTIEITALADRAFLKHGYSTHEIRQNDEGLVIDDVLTYGPELQWDESTCAIRYKNNEWTLDEDTLPPECPERLQELLGEYGWDHNTLYLYENGGQLWALIEWFYDYPLTKISDDVYAFPDAGLYHDEHIHFLRNHEGKISVANAGGIDFPRRSTAQTNAGVRKKEISQAVTQIRNRLKEEASTGEASSSNDANLIEIKDVYPKIKCDIRNATQDNWLGAKLYESPHALLKRPVAQSLGKADETLRSQNYGLIVYDAYQPWFVTKAIWEGLPEQFRQYFVDPTTGTNSNRGCALDLTLYELGTGEPVEMITGYQELSERAHPLYPGGTSRARWHQKLLRCAMQSAGFLESPLVWWHYEFRDASRYPILNLSFADILQGEPESSIEIE